MSIDKYDLLYNVKTVFCGGVLMPMPGQATYLFNFPTSRSYLFLYHAWLDISELNYT